MSGNSSSSNDSFPPSYFPFDCYVHEPGSVILTAFSITYILLLLPLCIFILHHGLQQRRQKKRSASSAATASHSDIFTYHMVVTELLRMFACLLLLCGVYTADVALMSVGNLLSYFAIYGLSLFHVLTCAERYLAVVHPITYLSLRNQRGIRIRNITISCVWLISFAGTGLILLGEAVMILSVCLLFYSVIVICFLSLSVLRVLVRPGPGEQGGGRERVDQSKLRAFYTIMAIMGVLVLKSFGDLVATVMALSGGGENCLFLVSEIWFHLPCSLVVPLLFLHRAGKLVCCKKSN